MKSLLVIPGVLLWGSVYFSTAARAELDPELAASSNKNEGGMYLGFGLKLGQAYATGGSNPGVGYFVSAEPGFVASRDSWARMEIGAELGTGAVTYRRKDDLKTDVDLTVPFYMLAKFGYGWSLGHSTFAIARIGAGPAFGSYRAETDGGADIKGDGMKTGLAGMLGLDFLMAAGSSFDFLAGASLTHMAFNFEEGKVDGEQRDIDETVNLNIPAVYLGGRFTF